MGGCVGRNKSKRTDDDKKPIEKKESSDQDSVSHSEKNKPKLSQNENKEDQRPKKTNNSTNPDIRGEHDLAIPHNSSRKPTSVIPSVQV